jgi:hypothetical protein
LRLRLRLAERKGKNKIVVIKDVRV